MKHNKHKVSTFIVICTLLTTLSCNENQDLAGRVSNYTFDGKEGDPIMADVGSRWIANYINQNQGDLKAYFFGRETLQNLLGTAGCQGLRFYYALDDEKASNLLVVGADSRGQDLLHLSRMGTRSSFALSTINVTPNLYDGAEGFAINSDNSKRWISNFNNQKPNTIQAHFFGHEIINQVLAQQNCTGIRCYYALNDSGVPQLLLVGVKSDGGNILPKISPNGRIEDGEGIMVDASYPCPTYCSGY